MRTKDIRDLKISKDPTRYRTRNLPPCGAVHQQTAAPFTSPNTVPLSNLVTNLASYWGSNSPDFMGFKEICPGNQLTRVFFQITKIRLFRQRILILRLPHASRNHLQQSDSHRWSQTGRCATGKVYPATGHEGAEGEQGYIYTLSLTCGWVKVTSRPFYPS